MLFALHLMQQQEHSSVKSPLGNQIFELTIVSKYGIKILYGLDRLRSTIINNREPTHDLRSGNAPPV